jgi:uncharacterized protein involved in exopolysaccharide biosynthesis
MAIGLLVGYFWSLSQPSTFSATTSVALEPVPMYVTPSTTELVAPEVSVDTDALLIGSPRVLAAVAAVVHEDPATVADQVTITASPNSHVLHITVSADTAPHAAEAADAAAAALEGVRRRTLGAIRIDQLRQLRLFATDQEQLLAKEQATSVLIPADNPLFAQILQLQADLETLEDARRDPLRVTTAAATPRHADYANTEVPLTSGAMVGLLCGCLLGAGRDRTRHLALRTATPDPLPTPFGNLPDGTPLHEDYHHAI